jgi:AcrR family transcriptional regulator
MSPAVIESQESSSTKQRLLEAAEDLFAASGFDGVSVDMITRRAKANRAAVSFHFGGKERLYIEAVKYAHRNCIQGAPFPEWPTGTPPEMRLGGFIRTMLARMTTEISAASAQLMMREMVQPTAACEEVVREYIRPMADVLVQILDEMLPADVPMPRRYMLGFSIVAQCLFYRTNRSVAALLMGEDEFRKLDVETLTEHVTAASLSMVRALQKRTGGRP